MDDIEARIDRLESVLEIERLLATYATCVDQARFDELGALFADATLRAHGGPGVMHGAEAVRSFYAATNRVHADGTLRTRHVCSNVVVDVAADRRTATADSYFVVLQATELLPLQPIVAGRYRDAFRRGDQGWAFAERVIFVDQVGEMREHLDFDLSVLDR
jgi:hypothetical protein